MFSEHDMLNICSKNVLNNTVVDDVYVLIVDN